MRTLRTIVIDPFRREIREAEIDDDLEEYERICGCHYIEFGAWINGEDIPYVSEFARWRESFVIGERLTFSGTGLTTGGDACGKSMSKSARVPLEGDTGRGAVRHCQDKVNRVQS
jgi:hypothetical protein